MLNFLYKILKKSFLICRSVPDSYNEKLMKLEIISDETVKTITNSYKDQLTKEFENLSHYTPRPVLQDQWSNFQYASNSVTYWDTGLNKEILNYIGQRSVYVPQDFVRLYLLET